MCTWTVASSGVTVLPGKYGLMVQSVVCCCVSGDTAVMRWGISGILVEVMCWSVFSCGEGDMSSTDPQGT